MYNSHTRILAYPIEKYIFKACHRGQQCTWYKQKHCIRCVNESHIKQKKFALAIEPKKLTGLLTVNYDSSEYVHYLLDGQHRQSHDGIENNCFNKVDCRVYKDLLPKHILLSKWHILLSKWHIHKCKMLKNKSPSFIVFLPYLKHKLNIKIFKP